MSVAHVVSVFGAMYTEEPPEEGQKMHDAIKATDGFERMFVLANGAEGLAISVWRDIAALEAAAEQRPTRRAQQASMGITVTPGEVYNTFTEL